MTRGPPLPLAALVAGATLLLTAGLGRPAGTEGADAAGKVRKGGTRSGFVSRRHGCFLFQPVNGVDIAAACKK